MNSRVDNGEKVLAQLGCAHIKPHLDARILVAGLGMGYTLAGALKAVNAQSQVTVVELIPEMVEWHKGPLGQCAGKPLQDLRTQIQIGQLKELLMLRQPAFDGILLTLDNSPKGLLQLDNHWLYSVEGLKDSYDTLYANGTLAICCAGPDPVLSRRLKEIGFRVDTRPVQAGSSRGSRPTIFLAKKR